MNKKFIIISILIVILAGILRFVELDRVPPSINQDEAATGVDAYYIGKTGKDHLGNNPGVMLETFGDFVSPVQTYLAIPIVKIFGLSEVSMRSSAALWGVITVIIALVFAYDIGKKVFVNDSFKRLFTVTFGFIFAISGWHIMMVRWALPSGLVPLLMLIVAWLIFKSNWSVNSRPSRYVYGILSAIFAGISVYSYPTMKLFMPIYIAAMLFIIYVIDFTRKDFLQNSIEKLKQNYLFISSVIAIFVIIIAPLFIITLDDPIRYQFRYDQVSIMGKNENPIYLFVSNYISYFSNSFLFQIGDTDAMRMMPFSGALGYGLVIPYYAGILIVILGSIGSRWLEKLKIYKEIDFKTISIILLIWMIVSPIPASLTVDRLHSFRVIHMMPALLMITAFGFTSILSLISNYIENKWVKLLALCLLVFPLLESFAVFSFAYYGYYYRDYVKPNFQYGVKESILYAGTLETNENKIIVDRTINTPYIYVLFYTRPDLSATKMVINRAEKGGWNDAKQVGKYYFEEIENIDSNCKTMKSFDGGEGVTFNVYQCPDKTVLIDKVVIENE